MVETLLRRALVTLVWGSVVYLAYRIWKDGDFGGH